MEDKQELLNALYVIRAGISVASQINDKIWDEQWKCLKELYDAAMTSGLMEDFRELGSDLSVSQFDKKGRWIKLAEYPQLQEVNRNNAYGEFHTIYYKWLKYLGYKEEVVDSDGCSSYPIDNQVGEDLREHLGKKADSPYGAEPYRNAIHVAEWLATDEAESYCELVLREQSKYKKLFPESRNIP